MSTLNGQHVSTLLPLYKCQRLSCPNASGHCYELDSVHLKFMPQNFRTWSMAINKGKADLETPPDGLIASLIVSKSGTFNSLRPGDVAKSQKSNSSSELTAMQSAMNASAMYPYPAFPQFPPYGYGPYTLPPAPLQPPPMPVHTATPPRFQFSDGLPDEVDRSEQLVAYIAWLIGKSALQSPALTRAKEVLMDEGYCFKTLDKITKEDFDRMGIKSGIALQLRSYIDAFKRKTMNHA